MPELPEVQTIVTTLHPQLRERLIQSTRMLRTDILQPPDVNLPALLQNRRIIEITRRGKKIVIRLDNLHQFFIHLGMTGRLTLESPAATEADLPRHTHLLINLDNGLQLRFHDPRRFGGVFWLGADGQADIAMGPEPLEMKTAELAEKLASTRRVIKSALLDQSLVAGLGNIYVDESLFQARIHPLTPANTLSRTQITALSRSIKQTLNRALKHKGSTLRDYRNSDGTSGDFQKLHRVYDRKGKPCPRCRTPIERIVIGGRSTHFCPNCQPSTIKSLAAATPPRRNRQ